MNERQMTLGADWMGENPVGWFASEKLDGWRVYWDGQAAWTRAGSQIELPPHIQLPKGVALDGELWAGRGNRSKVSACYKFKLRGRELKLVADGEAVKFVAFDAPNAPGDWMQRLETISGVEKVSPFVVESRRQMIAELQRVQAQGGEGLVIRNPAVKQYEQGRTENLLKVKKLLDEDWANL